MPWFDGTTTARTAAQLEAIIMSFIPSPMISATSTLSNVAALITSQTLLALNTTRVGATIFNDSASQLYVKLGATASATSYTILMDSQTYFEIPFGYTGAIAGIWVTATGNARIDELTP